MPANEPGDEGAEGNDRKALSLCFIKRRLDKSARHTSALQNGRNLRVCKDDDVVFQVVIGDGLVLAEVRFEALRLDIFVMVGPWVSVQLPVPFKGARAARSPRSRG